MEGWDYIRRSPDFSGDPPHAPARGASLGWKRGTALAVQIPVHAQTQGLELAPSQELASAVRIHVVRPVLQLVIVFLAGKEAADATIFMQTLVKH